MNGRTRRIVEIVALVLLAAASSARAECAWVLWITNAPAGLASPIPTVLSSYGSMADCVREIDGYERAVRGTPGALPRYSATRLVMRYAGQQEGYREVLCLPDTIDPRGAKGK